MASQQHCKRVRPGAIPTLCFTVLGCLNSQAQALSFQFGDDASLDIDTTLSYVAQWRVQEQSQGRMSPFVGDISNPVDRGFKLFNAANNDDGNRNFDKGLVSNKFTAVVDLDFNWRNLGVFLRGRAYYDTVYMNQSTDMDAVGYQTYNSGNATCCGDGTIGGDTAMGDFPDGTLDVNGQVVEMLDHFIYGTFELPGDRLFDLRLGSQVVNWGETTITPGISGLQNRFDQIGGTTVGAELKEIFLPTGAIYGQIDVTSKLTFETYYQYQWIENRLTGVGSYFGGTTGFDFIGPGAQNMLIPFGYNPDGSIAILSSVPKTDDIEPSDQGQWGAAFHYVTDGGTDYGVYFVNGHDKSPSLTRNDEHGNPAPPVGIPASYSIVYFDNIHGMAASFTSVWGKANVQGEVTYFQNTPIANADGVMERMPVTKLNFGGLYIFTPTPLWDDLNLLWEFTGVFANGKTDQDLQFDADAWGYVLRAEASYNNVLQGLDLKVPLFFQHALHGTWAGATTTQTDNAKALSIALQSIYLADYVVQLTYTAYFDGGMENRIADRDNIALSFKYAF